MLNKIILSVILCATVSTVTVTSRRIYVTLRNWDGAVFMNRTNYLKSGYSHRNGWEATVNLQRWRKSDLILMILKQPPGTIAIWDRNSGNFQILDDGWFIEVYKPIGGFDQFKFRLEADQTEPYPEISSLIVNGEEVCANHEEFGHPNPPTETPSIVVTGSTPTIGEQIEAGWQDVQDFFTRESTNFGQSVEGEASNFGQSVEGEATNFGKAVESEVITASDTVAQESARIGDQVKEVFSGMFGR